MSVLGVNMKHELGVIMDQLCGCTGCDQELGVITDQVCGCTGCDYELGATMD